MLQVPFHTIMEDKSDLSTHIVYSMDTDDVEAEPNLTADNQASVVVKLEIPHDSDISTANNPYDALHIQNGEYKMTLFNNRNLVCADDTTHADSKNSMECFKHEYKYEKDSTHVMVHNMEAGTSFFVKSEMPYDSGISTTQFPHNVGQDGKVKTEVIVHHNMDSGEDITHDDTQHSAGCNIKCLKHEYKDKEVSTSVTAPTVEAKLCAQLLSKNRTHVTHVRSHSQIKVN
jgi:hypothetical protein